jgi:RNA polymerase sigma-70 factor (ECF subfamily)
VKYEQQESNKHELQSEEENTKICFTDEWILVEQAKAGDEAAFGRLIEPHMRKAYHMALNITRNREDAEDAAQQGFLNGYAQIRQYRGQSKFSSWLLRIVINEALTKIRERKHQDHHLSYAGVAGEGSHVSDTLRADDAFHPEVLYARAERGRILRMAIDSLQTTLRVVVWMVGLEEKRTGEAARILNLSRSAVKTRYGRARQQLREGLAERI